MAERLTSPYDVGIRRRSVRVSSPGLVIHNHAIVDDGAAVVSGRGA
jgi:hypothetical protein